MILPRKRDRRRRVLRWAALTGAGAAAGLLAALMVGGWTGVALGAAVLLAALALAHPVMIAPPGVPILTYHSVSPDPSWLPWADEIAVHPETFERHLATLAKMGCTVLRTADYVALRAEGRPIPAGAVVLHFDDGYFDNWLFAAPLLKRFGMAGTFFASLDFIDPGTQLRSAPGAAVHGYMNWAELRALDSDPLFDVEPHGIDHGRVPISGRVVGTLTEENWRDLAWMQWANMPGPKHGWYLSASPPAVPLGTPVPESEGALAAPCFRDGALESDAEFRARVAADLHRCQAEFEERLGRRPTLFCWPENRVAPQSREVARELGYLATTGGTGRNTAGEPAAILSRIHVGDRALGLRWGPAEALRLRATVRLFQGNHYWYLVAVPMDLARRLLSRRRTGSGGLPYRG
jgi:peptidoglycan/xylan/chitin deacetylase (PgdA/CDA1 family)